MDLLNTPAARKLRRDIHALRVKKFGWSEETLHAVMCELGFGASLRALDENRLDDLKFLLVEIRPSGQPETFALDRQGRYALYLAALVGWSEADLRAFLIKRFAKTHWNVLAVPEKRAVIAMFHNYLSKHTAK